MVTLDVSEIGFPLYLAGDDGVRLQLGDCALVPARADSNSPSFSGDVVANGAAAVWAAPGPWDGREQLILVANWDQPDVNIEVGELVGAQQIYMNTVSVRRGP